MPFLHHRKKDQENITVFHSTHRSSQLPNLVIILMLGVLALSIIYYLNTQKALTTPTTSDDSNKITLRPILSQIRAQFSGQVTKIQGQTLYVIDQSGHTDQFDLGPQATLASDPTGTPLNPANLSSKIPLNVDLIFYLQYQNGTFQIVSIQPTPNVPPKEESISHPPSPKS